MADRDLDPDPDLDPDLDLDLDLDLVRGVGAVDLAATLGVVDDAVAQCILTLAVRIKRMLRALPR